MPRLKLTLEYDGTDFVGWQVQPNGRSVQATVESALVALLGAPTRVVAAGRTDSGVHARGQVVAFDTERALPLKAYVQGLNGILPPDVAVVRAEEAEPAFDPRRWALGKRYEYRIHNGRTRSPLRRRTHWELFQPLDVEAMRAAAQPLLGRHDFSAFRAANCQAKHAVRELRRVDLTSLPPDDLLITVEGTAFLKHMVRNIVGTLVEVGRGKEPPGWVGSLLQEKDRTLAGMTAPPQGLTMVEVFYGSGPRTLGASSDDGGDDDEA